jgi:hypothetical protein
MWNNWIGRRIRDSSRRLLFWGLILTLGAISIAWVSRDSFVLALRRPVSIDAADLASPEFLKQLAHGYVTFQSADAVDTGSVIGYAKRKDKIVARYLVVPAGEHWLLVKVPAAHSNDTFAGYLAKLTKEESDSVIPGYAGDKDIDRDLFLPIQLDCTLDLNRGAVAGLFFFTVFLIPGMALTIMGLRRLRQPELHPLAKSLDRLGPPAEVANSIDPKSRPLRLGPIEFVDDWLICYEQTSGWVVFRVHDLVWVHKLVETVNRTPLHRVKIYDRLGGRFVGRGRPDVIDAATAAITERLPWLVIGWDERVAQQWQDDPASLVPRVEERRQELLARQ